MLQHLDRHILGKMPEEMNPTSTQESADRRAGGFCPHIYMQTHTQASCCNTLTFLTAVQLQEKKKFQHTCQSEKS